ncbi:MAG: efflux RND transporter permease subunit [Burkholderiaceae bacterium]|nr:efflux RND transporter permease subunit [Burkholderiaceae bacterium]
MAKFFINRPIFAWVIAIVIMLAGMLSILNLPISQYPQIAPPQVSITASYPGASAKTIEDTVVQIIEQKMTGLDGYLYMNSSSDSAGRIQITLTFIAGTNPDMAQVQVQNRLSQAESSLPEIVQRLGITVIKTTASFLKVVALTSKDGSITNAELGDYLKSNVEEPLSRVKGVGQVDVYGSNFSMRIWLDPEKLYKYGLVPTDVTTAISTQNVQVSSGQIGGMPAVQGTQLNATISSSSLLQTVEEFENIFLKTMPNGSQVYLKDVSRIEKGEESYEAAGYYNGKPAAGIAIRLAAGANALETSDLVNQKMEELSAYFPEGYEYVVPYDTTPFVRVSIKGVVQTLFEAVILVVCVMYLFLQNMRATLIPTIAVPVVVLGTFGVLAAMGYSINMLTMFAMVLAIGLLVDDAIVVVENVERIMHEEKLSPHDATEKSMGQITGALVGIAMVLSAVFIPMAFFGGSTGVIYRQFSVTIVAAMALSVLVALTLTPALCATILRPIKHEKKEKGFFGWFNRIFNIGAEKSTNAVGHMVPRWKRYIAVYGLIIGLMVYGFMRVPSSFMPDEDQGSLLVQVELPAGSTREQLAPVVDRVKDYFLKDEQANVEGIMTVVGFSFSGQGQNSAMAFVSLKDWSERKGEENTAQGIAMRANRTLLSWKDSLSFSFAIPPVPELGMADGFDFYLQDLSGAGHDKLMEARNQLLAAARANPKLYNVRPNGKEDSPQFNVKIDFAKAASLGVSVADINNTLSVAWGSTYVNDFYDRGRIKKVYVQADAPFRKDPEDINRWYVRNNQGEMVPFSAFTSTSWSYGSPRLERFNGLSAVNIQGSPARGLTTGQAMEEIEKIAETLPPGFAIAWNGISFQERQAGSQTTALYSLSVVIVFLCLAALYESWSIPVAVIMVVPLGVVGAIGLTGTFGMNNDIYFQVGLLTTIGLVSKNAILIVEFAKELHEKGMSAVSAAMQAVRLRIRPIIMTSLAFGLGVLPLAKATGAGSGAQNAIGIGVLGGMMTGTFLCIIFVPMFYVLILKVFGGKRKKTQKLESQEVTHE